MRLTSKAFWAATGERAVRTLAQSAAAALIAAGTGLVDSDWLGVLSVAGMAAVLSVLTSVGASGSGHDGPAITGPETVDYQPRHAATEPDEEG